MSSAAAQAYARVANTTASPRDIEAQALLMAANKLQAVMTNAEATFEQASEALMFNRKLWTIFLSEARRDESPQPLDVRQRFFVEPFLRIERNAEDVYDDGDRIAKYAFFEGYAQADVGINIGTMAQLRAGVRSGWDEANLTTGSASTVPEINTVQESDFVLRAVYDTRDTPGVPSRGTLLIGQYMTSGSWFGGEQSYDLLETMALQVLPFRRDTLYLFGAGGWDLGTDLPPYRLFPLGGIRSFPGLERQQLRGTGYWVAGSSYNWKLADIQQLFGQALYGGLRLTAGDVTGRVDDINEGVIYGLAATLSGRTLIGPMLVSLGATDTGFWQLQLNIGRPIKEGLIVDDIW